MASSVDDLLGHWVVLGSGLDHTYRDLCPLQKSPSTLGRPVLDETDSGIDVTPDPFDLGRLLIREERDGEVGEPSGAVDGVQWRVDDVLAHFGTVRHLEGHE